MTAPTRIATDTDTTGAVNATTLACDLQTVIAAAAQVGDKVVTFCGCDGVASQSVSAGAGWTKIDFQLDALAGGSQMNLTLFECDVTVAATVADLTIAFGASQMAYVRHILIRPATGTAFATRILAKVGGDSTNPDPPSITNSTGSSQDLLVIAAASADANGTSANAVMTGGPSGYNSIGLNNVGNTQGVSLSVADRAVTLANAASENPSAWTHPTEQWAAMTLGYYGVSSGTPVGEADETDVAMTLSARQITATGLATAANTALALSGVQIRAVGIASDSETAFALTPVQITATGRASETDAALALTSIQIAATGLASETDSALALGSARPVGVANDNETALALTAGSSAATGRADETDTALALSAVQIAGVGLATEADAAFALGVARPADAANENDEALALVGVTIIGVPVPARRTTYASPSISTAANDILTTYASPATGTSA